MDKLTKVGEVAAVPASAVKRSKIGIGFEKLDRGVFDPNKAYDKIAAIGVKWIRLQSGWARTEQSKGVYDFTWLDDIVDNLRSRGLWPWLCLCYGNGLYDEEAAKIFGAVGCPPIKTAEQRQAWHNYVVAAAQRYRGRIGWYEVWNEPDGKWCWKHGVSGEEYGEFVKATAAAIKQGDPDAKVIGGSMCLSGLGWLNEVFNTGAAACMDALTYHSYSPDEAAGFERVRSLRAVCRAFNPQMEIIQGETGAQSRDDGAGALRGAAWTPLRQAKFLARHTMADLFAEVMFTSYFSSVDMIEALNGLVGDKSSYLDYGYFGVLAADFDEDGIATGEYRPKPSYRALQTIAAIFREDLTLAELPLQFSAGKGSPRLLRGDDSFKDLLYRGFRKDNGSAGLVYWRPCELLSTSYEATVSLEAVKLPEKVRLVDLVDGSIYTLPPTMIEDNGRGLRSFLHLPLRDYPLLLAFGDFI
jgi:hypothetical protein